MHFLAMGERSTAYGKRSSAFCCAGIFLFLSLKQGPVKEVM
jgi:hypothetical protein